MRAELVAIHDDQDRTWDEFCSLEQPSPFDDFGLFTIGVGFVGEGGSDLFTVLVATPAAVTRAQGDSSRFKGLVVDEFNPDVIYEGIRAFVSSCTGSTEREVVAKLRQKMGWEYERMAGYP